MKSATRVLTLLFFTIAGASCAKGDGSSNNPLETLKQTGKTIELQGKTFESEDCMDPVVMKLFSAKGYKVRLNFTGDRVTRTVMFYPDSACHGDVAATLTKTGSFEQKDSGPEGSHRIDMHYNNLKLTINSNEGKNFAETEALGACGRKTWNVNETVDVTAQAGKLNCYNQPMPQSVQEIYKLDGTRLIFGRGIDDSKDSGKTPNRLNMDETFRSI